ncbi:MAG: sugar nucleotide-binding protein, partial [Planctomycetes bacterium]|nr:sugar nucleotide-binding protein [Planctomycetota bacterium]
MKRILITGAGGFLGSHVARRLSREGHVVFGTFGQQVDRFRRTFDDTPVQGLHVDLAKQETLAYAFQTAGPDLVVHCAALSDPNACQKSRSLAQILNVDATETLARLCLDQGARMIFFSTDQVFDGKRGGYKEGDPTQPMHVYGETKVQGEDRVLTILGGAATVLRIALVYGNSPTGRRSATEQVL